MGTEITVDDKDTRKRALGNQDQGKCTVLNPEKSKWKLAVKRSWRVSMVAKKTRTIMLMLC